MTTREEAQAKLNMLSDLAFEEVVKIINRQVHVEKQLAALKTLAESWTAEEEA